MINLSSGGPKNGRFLALAVIPVALHQLPATTDKGHGVIIAQSRRTKAF
jgi:hypothetical protein